VAEVEHDLEAKDPPEAVSLVEDVSMVETIGLIEDAQEVEAIGHIDDEVSLENNGVAEETTTGNTFSLKNPRTCAKMIFDFLNALLLACLLFVCCLNQTEKVLIKHSSPLLSSSSNRFSYR
jgi:hypothetical protein